VDSGVRGRRVSTREITKRAGDGIGKGQPRTPFSIQEAAGHEKDANSCSDSNALLLLMDSHSGKLVGFHFCISFTSVAILEIQKEPERWRLEIIAGCIHDLCPLVFAFLFNLPLDALDEDLHRITANLLSRQKWNLERIGNAP
jgi:hypothetical protein